MHESSELTTFEQQRRSLDALVVDPDLADLEQRLGRFNLFDALRIVRRELQHSNFLAWLLNPRESHGQGPLFLRSLLIDLVRSAPLNKAMLSAVELDAAELGAVEVRREWRRIDLLILSQDPRFVVAFENKVDAGEHSNQLQRYEETIDREFAEIPRTRRMFVLLSPDGREPTDPDWIPYSYSQLIEVVTRCNATGVEGDVRVVLEHYTRLIRSQFMNDPVIDDLCKKLYDRHRQAINLVYERAGGGRADLMSRLATELKKDGRWRVLGCNTSYCVFTPRLWPEPHFPGDGGWAFPLKLMFHCPGNVCALFLEVQPYRDVDVRRRIIDALLAPENELGFRSRLRNLTQVFTRVHRVDLVRWAEDEQPNPDSIWKKAVSVE